MMKRKACKRCGRKFFPTVWNKIYCGSKIQQTGCSWWNVNENRNKRRWQNPNYKNYQREYGKRWKKIQRALNTDYAVRQLRHKMDYYYRGGKEVGKKWRRKNIDKILFWNKKRILANKNIVGKHTWQEWQELKIKYKNKCVICGINESGLREKWGNKFSKLTEDHIIPISKGGTDYIKNIQPLCISCNAKKKDT